MLPALGLAVVLATFRDYGLTWDEWLQARYGELALAYFRSGFVDTRCNEVEDLRYYGPVFEMLAALVHRHVGGSLPEIRHLLSAVAGLAGVLGVMAYARLAGRRWLPAFAGAALLLLPRFYGNSFVNSKDVPFAAALTWAMVGVAGYLLRGRRWRDAAWTGVAIGVALALRPGGLPLFGLLLAAALALDLTRAAPAPRLRSAGQVALLAVLAWAVMVASWPWAHGGPLLRPLLASAVAARFPAALPVLFEGVHYAPGDLPWRYLTEYLVITTPPAHLALLVLGAAAALGPPLRRPDASREPVFLARLALVWFVAPLLAALVQRPVIYDGIRHFLFLLPALAVLAAFGAERLAGALAGRLPRAAALVGVAFLLPLPALARLHPYQYTYFNAFVGGVAGAAGRYDTDYWLSSYKEAIEWINRQPLPAGRRLRVAVAATAASRWCADHYARPELEIRTVVEAQRDPDWRYEIFLATTRFGMSERATAPIVHTVGRDGAVFAVVRRRAAP